MPYAGAAGGEAVDGIADTTAVAAETSAVTDDTVNGIVTIDKLQNDTSLKKKMTDAEFQTAYNEALKIVQPLVGLSREEQAMGIMTALRIWLTAGRSHIPQATPTIMMHTAIL